MKWLDNFGKAENANEGKSKPPFGVHPTGSQIGNNYNGAWGGQFKSGGYVSRKNDYGSKSKPYPTVDKKDFAGGGRSYPIPSEHNARSALFLAKIHHRPDVIAKVHAKYPNLGKKQVGGVIKDNMGQWAHPGKITQIDDTNITMKHVDYPVIGLSDTGDVKLMKPGKDYKFRGNNVTEYPITKNGINFTKNNKWLDNL